MATLEINGQTVQGKWSIDPKSVTSTDSGYDPGLLAHQYGDELSMPDWRTISITAPYPPTQTIPLKIRCGCEHKLDVLMKLLGCSEGERALVRQATEPVNGEDRLLWLVIADFLEERGRLKEAERLRELAR